MHLRNNASSEPLNGFPAGRGTDINPVMEGRFRHTMQNFTPADNERVQKHIFEDVSPLLLERYGSSCNLDVLEIGPYTTTAVARTMGTGRCRHYLGMDGSPSLAMKQQEFLKNEGLAFAHSLAGDAFCMPFPAKCQDLIVVIGCTPYYAPETSPDQRVVLYNELCRVLRDDGEAFLHGISLPLPTEIPLKQVAPHVYKKA